MTVQAANITNGFYFPVIPSQVSGAPTVSNLTIDAANEKAGFMIQAPKTGNIRKIHFRTNTVTTGATVDVRVETVDTSASPAKPSGTLWGTNTNGSQVIASTDDNAYFRTTLTADAAVTRGDFMAIVIANPAASFGNINICVDADNQAQDFPHCMLYTTSWANNANGSPLVGLEYDDGSLAWVTQCPFWKLVTTVTFNNTSATRIWANEFSLPFPASVSGFWAWLDNDGDWTGVLYDSDGATALASLAVSANIGGSTAGGLYEFIFSSSVTLKANTLYKIAIKPTSATNLSIYYWSQDSTAAMDALPAGTAMYLTGSATSTPTSNSDWSDTASSRLIAGLIFDGFDDGSYSYTTG